MPSSLASRLQVQAPESLKPLGVSIYLHCPISEPERLLLSLQEQQILTERSPHDAITPKQQWPCIEEQLVPSNNYFIRSPCRSRAERMINPTSLPPGRLNQSHMPLSPTPALPPSKPKSHGRALNTDLGRWWCWSLNAFICPSSQYGYIYQIYSFYILPFVFSLIRELGQVTHLVCGLALTAGDFALKLCNKMSTTNQLSGRQLLSHQSEGQDK